MKLPAHRECAATPGPARPEAYETTARRAVLPRAGAVTCAAVLLSVVAMGPATAQQTVVIGDDKPGVADSGPARPDTAGVVINNDVLDSLGSPGAYAPALPPTPPYTAPAQAGQAPLAAPGAPGVAYRLPGSGQLVISRPSTLLFPPQTFPSSRLTVPAPARRLARTPATPDTGKAPSRLLVPKPAAPRVARPEPAPGLATAAPRDSVAEAPMGGAPAPEMPAAMPPVSAPGLAAEPAPIAPIAPNPEPMAPPAMAELPPAPSPVPDLPSQPRSAGPSPQSEPARAPSLSDPAAKAAPAPSRSAALPSAREPVGERRLVFNEDSAELTALATGQLDGMAEELLSNTGTRVQLLAYAKASDDGASRARRLSLSRALAVRAYLIEKGIPSTRMDVRALGSGFEDGPSDRVDVRLQNSAE
jgi:outer membrane protein OmpA-like peptidoglycan-associated protein